MKKYLFSLGVVMALLAAVTTPGYSCENCDGPICYPTMGPGTEDCSQDSATEIPVCLLGGNFCNLALEMTGQAVPVVDLSEQTASDLTLLGLDQSVILQDGIFRRACDQAVIGMSPDRKAEGNAAPREITI